MTGRRFRFTPLVSLVVAIILLSVTPGVAFASRERYIPPTAVAPAEPEIVTANHPALHSTGDPVIDTATTPAPVPEGVISAQAVAEAPVPDENVRPRPETRPIELAATQDPTPEPTEAPPAGPVRLDEPVLRWLPEILLAAEESGTPAHIIAGVMRLESGGNPNIISPVGARGLMQIMPSNLTAMGFPESLWHDPATNIRAGGLFLASRAQIHGSWDQAVGAYFGFGCDVFGTCTEVYIQVALSWAAYYQPAITDPLSSGFAVLPAGWTPPPINPFVEAAPVPVSTPPATPAPTETPSETPAPSPTATPEIEGTPAPSPTGEPSVEPTPVPTDIPTVESAPVPTEAPTVAPVPTDVPAQDPTAIPTEDAVEVEPPPDPGTPPA